MSYIKLSIEEKLELTHGVMALLDSWEVSGDGIVFLLALPANIRARHVQRFRQDTPFPDELAVLERIEHLIGIADALRTTFPRNQLMGKMWLHQPHRRFNQRTPMQCMLEDGLAGIVEVRAHVDCAFDWQMDAQKNQPSNEEP